DRGLTPSPSPEGEGREADFLLFPREDLQAKPRHDRNPPKKDGKFRSETKRAGSPALFGPAHPSYAECGSVFLSLTLATRAHDSLHDREARCGGQSLSIFR